MTLREEGPNDGATLLVDEIAPAGTTIVDFGVDHFLARDPDIDTKTAAMARTLLKHLEGTFEENLYAVPNKSLE